METKPGFQTTEFWLTVIANIVVALDLAGVWNTIPDKWAAVVGGFVTAAYAISRGHAKQGVKPDPPTT